MANRRSGADGLRAVFLLVLSAATGLGAQFGLPEPVDPKTYVSPSGRWSLDVDPSSIDGQGDADYILKNEGRVSWSGRKPFTLLDAEVADNGVVAGYAYSGGLVVAEGSKIHLIILDASGKAVLNKTEDREESRVIHGGPEPWVNGVLLDEETDRVTFRLDDHDRDERWKTFRLSDGKPVSTFELTDPAGTEQGYAWLNDVRVVRGTPLNLVAWGIEDLADERARPDIRFALLDTAGNVFWQHDLPKDRAPRATQGDKGDVNLPGALPHGKRGEFEIRSFRTGERVLFRVTGDGRSGYRVAEIQRRSLAPQPGEAAQAPGAEEIVNAVTALPPITLGRNREGGPNPTQGVQQFDIDAKGRFGFARRDAACAVTFVLMDGDSAREYALGSLALKPNECYGPLVAWAGGSTWLVSQEYAKGGRGPIGWWIDSGTGAIRPFTITEPLMVLAVAGTGQGAVVVLAADDNFADTLLWLDSSNVENRDFRKNIEADRGELLSPEDLTVTRGGDIAVIDVVRHVIEVFARSGAHKRSIDLEAKWGREPSYPSGLSADGEGGFLVDDFGAELPLVRILDTGSIRAELKPQYSDRTATGRIYRLRVAPDGRLWGSDGEALLQFDDRGVVVDSIGPSAGVHRLGEVAAWAVDSDERIYAVDRRSGGVHVFDSKGMDLRTCSPLPGQIADALYDPSLSVSIDGRVLLRTSEALSETEAFLEFSPTCALTTREVSARSLFWAPSAGGLWAQRFRELALLDAQGKEKLRINRRPDGRWLSMIYHAVIADDGSLAIATGARKDDGRESWALNVFDADGKPRSIAFLPSSIDSGTFAFDGRRVVAWDAGRLRIMDVAGRTMALLAAPKDIQAIRKMPILLSRNGREAWVLDGERRVVHRIPLS